MKLDFHVMNMTRADVVLGCEWLHGLGSSLSRSYQHNSLTFEDNGVPLCREWAPSIEGGGMGRAPVPPSLF